MPSGVGIQCNKLLRGLNRTGKYEIVQIAGSLLRQNPQPVILDNIKLYPTADGYGNPNLIRQVMSVERPDIVLAFSDPRFFIYLFMMDNEIRGNSKLVFYHTWDNEPFPKFNLPWYSACDHLVYLSKFSYELAARNGLQCECIPHGMDPSEFYPLPSEIVQQERNHLFGVAGKPDTKFVIFWNNRNITRKRPADVVWAFNEFYKTHPDSLLLMNTSAIDSEGTDLPQIIRDLKIDAPVVFNFQKLETQKLNLFYNVADVVLLPSINEGFGLSVAESLCATTPVIATRTGGITEQMSKVIHHEVEHSDNGPQCEAYDEEKQFGILMDPAAKELYGVPGMPYIFRDYVSYDQMLSALDIAYRRHKGGDWKRFGVEGREHIIENYHIDSTVRKWDDLLAEVHSTPSTYRKWQFSIH